MKFFLVPVAIIASIAVGYVLYEQMEAQEAPAIITIEKTPLAVRVTQPTTRDVVDQVEFVGSLEPKADVQIRSRVRGYITALPYDVGDFVRIDIESPGPVVVETDNASSRELLNSSQAALRVAQAQLQAKIASEQFAASNVQRQATLQESGAVTPEEAEQAQSELLIAKAEVELEVARVAKVASDVEQSKLALLHTQIEAPFSGFVAERLVEVGDLANPDDPLLRIVDISIVKTIVFVVEKDFPRIKIGQGALLQVDAYPKESFPGRVVRTSPVLDPDTRTAPIHIEIANPQHRLKPGMHARVTIETETRKNTLVVPVAALLEHATEPLVCVVEGEPPCIVQRSVVTGINNGKLVEILAGIDQQDSIVTLGSHLVENGQQVHPLPVPPETELNHSPNVISSSVVNGAQVGGE